MRDFFSCAISRTEGSRAEKDGLLLLLLLLLLLPRLLLLLLLLLPPLCFESAYS